MENGWQLTRVGTVRSPLRERGAAPCQADEGAPAARLEFTPNYAAALADVAPGDELLVLTWLHAADRATQTVHPRGDLSRPPTGVFSTRSPDRPNPIGLHRVTVTARDGNRIDVDALEAIDGTPIVDVKPVLRAER